MDERKSLDELELLGPKELGKLLLLEMNRNIGRYDYIRDIINAGANLEIRNKEGETALHLSARYDNMMVFKYLLEAGANVNNDTNSILHSLVAIKDLVMVKMIVASGVDLEYKNDYRRTPLHYAAVCSISITEFLIESGADITAKDIYDNTPWNMAALTIKSGVPQLNPDYNE